MFKQYENICKDGIEKALGSYVSTTSFLNYLEAFSLYGKLLMQWNEKINLTAIVDPYEILMKHFLDSLYFGSPILKYKGDLTTKILDIGTGAGFPGVPLKIVLENLDVTLMDAVQKKLFFLNNIIEQLHLDKVYTLHGRAEDIAQRGGRSSYDIVVSRAVASLPVLLEYALPAMSVGGIAIFGKGKSVTEEVEAAKNALKVLHAEIIEIKKYDLDDLASHRALVVVKKVTETPEQYPRKAGVPKKKPL